MFFKPSEIIRYDFDTNGFSHYIKVNRRLSDDEVQQLKQILASFPHSDTYGSKWPQKFSSLDFASYPKELLFIAANAYDKVGNTVLGIACEYGEDIKVVQQLINMGANINLPDDNSGKLPIHWAINNKLSFRDKNSYEAVEVVKCLLHNNARINITCYEDCTPLRYAEKRGYTAAANLIRSYNTERTTIGLFEGILPPNISIIISQFLDEKDARRIAQVRKAAWSNAKKDEQEEQFFIQNDSSKRLKL